MSPKVEDLTTFWTWYGTFKYKVMPFGLTNRLAMFQRFINKVFMDYLNNFMIAFVDNILIYSDNKVEHQEYVKKVLKHF
jgi:hypothetical protein